MVNILLSRGILGDPKIVSIASNYIKEDMKVCIVYFSFFDKHLKNEKEYQEFYAKGSEYYEKMVNAFIPYGVKESQLTSLNYYTDSKEEMIKKIGQADIIYYPGGAPDQMMDRIKQKGIFNELANFDGIVIGSSAGAMIQNDIYHISPDYDYTKFSINHGLGYIKDFGYEVHFRRKKIQKKAIRRVTNLLSRPLYVIPDDGCLIVTPKKIYTINTAKLYYSVRGKVK